MKSESQAKMLKFHSLENAATPSMHAPYDMVRKLTTPVISSHLLEGEEGTPPKMPLQGLHFAAVLFSLMACFWFIYFKSTRLRTERNGVVVRRVKSLIFLNHYCLLCYFGVTAAAMYVIDDAGLARHARWALTLTAASTVGIVLMPFIIHGLTLEPESQSRDIEADAGS